MALAYGGHVYEYIAGGPFDDVPVRWDLSLNGREAPRSVSGRVVEATGLDTTHGFIPDDNDGEIWPVVNRTETGDLEWPEAVDIHFHGPMLGTEVD